MAYTRAQLGSEKVRPIVGRNGMLDRFFQIVGPQGMRIPVADLNSTVPTTVAHGGVTRITGLSSTQGPVQNNLPAPSPGEIIELVMTCTSTGSQQFLSTPNGAAIIAATLGTTVGVVNFIGPGGSVSLRALSTALWGVISRAGTSASWPTFSTST
jgi:hypothetical protein